MPEPTAEPEGVNPPPAPEPKPVEPQGVNAPPAHPEPKPVAPQGVNAPPAHTESELAAAIKEFGRPRFWSVETLTFGFIIATLGIGLWATLNARTLQKRALNAASTALAEEGQHTAAVYLSNVEMVDAGLQAALRNGHELAAYVHLNELNVPVADGVAMLNARHPPNVLGDFATLSNYSHEIYNGFRRNRVLTKADVKNVCGVLWYLRRIYTDFNTILNGKMSYVYPRELCASALRRAGHHPRMPPQHREHEAARGFGSMRRLSN